MKSYSLIFILFVWFALVTMSLFPLLSNAQTSCTPEGILFDDTTNQPIGECDPASVSAPYQFSRSGLFGCSQTAAYRMSVGALSAVGGVYVPVNDAAVTLNTGYLVYKECILDGASKRIAESASTGITSKGIRDALTGKNGKPLWSEDLIAETLERNTQSVVHTLESGQLSPVNSAFRDPVVRTVARSYMAETQAANRVLGCPYQGDLSAVLKGTTNDVWGGLMTFTNPVCNPIGAFHAAQTYTENKAALAQGDMLFRLMTGQGFYGVEEYDPATDRYITRTPGYIVAENLQYLLTSGLRQLENADEIDQMVGALFSGLSTQVISDSRGLAGLLQSTAGQPSYLDQMTREAAQGLRDSASNIAIQILNGARQIEITFLNAMNAIATLLTTTIQQLREAENRCWDLVIPQARTYATQNNFQIQVATSTQFSQQVIDSQISPLASVTVTNVQKSEQALAIINNLIAGITNTTSLEAQRLALQQLDSLVARGTLHNQYDAQQAEARKGEVEASMATLLEDTIVAWADSLDTAIGWCNVNNSNVAKMWAERWRR